METRWKVPSDLPVDPVLEGDPVDSPIPDLQDDVKEESQHAGDNDLDDSESDGDDSDETPE